MLTWEISQSNLELDGISVKWDENSPYERKFAEY